jgi:NitT/TauT family transport system substrate-binding protein
MTMHRSTALALLAGGVVAAARPAVAQPAPATVRMGSLGIDASGESYYGTDSGVFQSNGINPQVTTLTNGAAITAAVVGGTLDVGQANPFSVAGAIARGIPLQMIAPSALYSKRDQNFPIVVAKNSPIKSPKELIGGTFGVGALGDFNSLALFAWLDANGVPRDQVKLVEMPFGEVGSALQRGTVQAAFITEPFKSDAMQAGLIRDFADPYISIAPEIAVVVWFTSKNWLSANPDTAKKLVTAIYATARWSNSHFQQSGATLAKVAKMDPAVVAKMIRVYFATSNERKYVEPMLTLAAKYNLLPKPVSFDDFSAFPAQTS